MEHIIRIMMVAAIPLIFAITLHEAAHGLVAKWLGDKTAYMLGRVTANPIKHIDPIGTILVPIAMVIMSGGAAMLGWAKPVPVTWQNLKNPRRDMAIVALAGPAMNLIMAIFWALMMHIGLYVHQIGDHEAWLQIGSFITSASAFGIIINVLLMVFNMLPIPPLDGSRLLTAILPGRISVFFDRIEPYGLYIVLALLFLGVFRYVVLPPVLYLSNLIATVFGPGPIV